MSDLAANRKTNNARQDLAGEATCQEQTNSSAHQLLCWNLRHCTAAVWRAHFANNTLGSGFVWGVVCKAIKHPVKKGAKTKAFFYNCKTYLFFHNSCRRLNSNTLTEWNRTSKKSWRNNGASIENLHFDERRNSDWYFFHFLAVYSPVKK